MSYTIDVHLSAEEVRRQMQADAVKGLQAEQKSIPPVWFYDEHGSKLFEEITQLPEYYPTRAERALLEQHSPAIAELAQADTLVELGAGACDKTRVLLSALRDAGTLSRYVPFDVSDEFLRNAAADLGPGIRQPGHAPRHRRLPPAPVRDTGRRPQDGGVPGRDDREPRPPTARTVPLRLELHHVERRLAAVSAPTSSRTGDASSRPTTMQPV